MVAVAVDATTYNTAESNDDKDLAGDDMGRRSSKGWGMVGGSRE